VTLELLVARGVVRKGRFVKILARGEINSKVNVHAHAVSKAAEAAITAAGGSVTSIRLPFKAEGKAGRRLPGQPVRKPVTPLVRDTGQLACAHHSRGAAHPTQNSGPTRQC
jgi:hypothetical protein